MGASLKSVPPSFPTLHRCWHWPFWLMWLFVMKPDEFSAVGGSIFHPCRVLTFHGKTKGDLTSLVCALVEWCPWTFTRKSWSSGAPPIAECYDIIAFCCWQMYFQVPQPDLKAVEKLAWMTPFLQVHVGTHRVWLPCRPLVRTVLLIWVLSRVFGFSGCSHCSDGMGFDVAPNRLADG